MRDGIRLGVDVGRARIGIARSDPSGLIATPVETVPRGEGDLARIRSLADELDALELVVGLPVSLSGSDTASTEDARVFAAELAAATGRPVRLLDERLTTVSAQTALRGSKRKGRSQRAVIDQVAAVILLQHALDAERARGNPAGALVDQDGGS